VTGSGLTPQILQRSFRHQPAAAHHPDAVGHALGDLQDVRRHHDGAAGADALAKHALHLAGGAGVEAGCSVVMTTHILEVAERMADRIGVMADGVLIAEGTLDELRRREGSGHATLEDTFLALVAKSAVE
jgi:ABC-type Na+ transport system ATPase subunit NatA